MYKSKSIAVVVPCFNEQSQIARVLETIPAFVDRIIVVDDCSTDGTLEVVRRFIAQQSDAERVVFLVHEVNLGVGRSIADGYKEAVRQEIDVTAVMAGDGQMDPDELPLLVEPVATGRADYAKGNRLFHHTAWQNIPRHRYLGNAVLSMLTKVASGYWHSVDSQCGYTAISLLALQLIDLDGLYPRYGYPNDMLVNLNLYDMRVTDVPIRPIYNIGEQSKMRLRRVAPALAWMIFRRFLWRLGRKHVIHDFHPLVLFYASGSVVLSAGTLFGGYLLWHRLTAGPVAPTSAMFCAFLLMTGIQLLLFGMWFDMQNNRELRVVSRPPVRRKRTADAGSDTFMNIAADFTGEPLNDSFNEPPVTLPLVRDAVQQESNPALLRIGEAARRRGGQATAEAASR